MVKSEVCRYGAGGCAKLTDKHRRLTKQPLAYNSSNIIKQKETCS